jgi:hypothetical protein
MTSVEEHRAGSRCLIVEHVVDAAAHDAARRPDETDEPFETVLEDLKAPLKLLCTVVHGDRPSMVAAYTRKHEEARVRNRLYATRQGAAVGRKLDVDELVGATEIAQRLRLAQPQTVHSWRRRYSDFPKPVATLKQALVWYWPDVARWARQTGRL